MVHCSNFSRRVYKSEKVQPVAIEDRAGNAALLHERESVRKFILIMIRIMLAFCFAYIVSLVFFRDTSLERVLGLGLILFCLAYLFEYARRKNKE